MSLPLKWVVLVGSGLLGLACGLSPNIDLPSSAEGGRTSGESEDLGGAESDAGGASGCSDLGGAGGVPEGCEDEE